MRQTAETADRPHLIMVGGGMDCRRFTGGNIIQVQPAHDLRFLWAHLSVAGGRTEIPMGNRKSYRNDSRPDHNLLPVCHAESEYPEEICA